MKYRPCLEALPVYVPGRPIEDVKREYGLDNVIKLASNENPRGCSPLVIEAIAKSFRDTRLYPDGNCTLLRNAVAGKYNVPPERIVFGAGSDEVMSMLAKVLIEPGDEGITAKTTFSQYAAAVESMGGKMLYAPMKDRGYDLKAVAGLVTERTKLIFIANPNNPTGTYFAAAEQEELMESVPDDVMVVFDEAYGEYVTAADFPDTPETVKRYKNAALLKTFSKIYGIASLRVGFGIMDGEAARQIEKIRSPFNVSLQGQAGALAAIGDEGFVSKSFLENKTVKEKTAKTFSEMGLRYIPSQANFLTADVKRDSRELFTELMKKGYIIRAGAALAEDLKTFIRVTVGTEEQMDGFLKVLKETL
jgi:histidinol-phosphate aminotransferase